MLKMQVFSKKRLHFYKHGWILGGDEAISVKSLKDTVRL
jgi:hypothetical protein